MSTVYLLKGAFKYKLSISFLVSDIKEMLIKISVALFVVVWLIGFKESLIIL